MPLHVHHVRSVRPRAVSAALAVLAFMAAIAPAGLTGVGPATAVAQEDAAPAMSYGGPAHTGEQPGPGPELAEGASPVVRWSFETGAPVRSAPAIAAGIAYVGSNDGFLYAIETETGKQVWRFETGAEIRTSPAVADGLVYFGGRDGDVFALDAASGEVRWRFPTIESIVAAPTVANGVVYVASREFVMFAIDAATGQERWHRTLRSPTISSPTVAGAAAYVGNELGVFATDLRTGDLSWPREPGTDANEKVAEVVAAYGSDVRFGVLAPLSAANGVVYAAGLLALGEPGDGGYATIGLLVAVQSSTGDVLWSREFHGELAPEAAPAVANGLVYVATSRGFVHAIDARNGAEQWSFKASNAPLTGGLAIADGVLYAGSHDRTLYAMDAQTGAPTWSLALAAPIRSAPAVVGGVVYVGSDDGRLYAIGAQP